MSKVCAERTGAREFNAGLGKIGTLRMARSWWVMNWMWIQEMGNGS